VYPPELAEWALANGNPQPPSAMVQADCQPGESCAALAMKTGADTASLVLTSPDPNSTLRLADALPADVQRVRLAARSNAPQALRRVTFLVNGSPVGEATAQPFEIWWPLARGAHAIRAVGADAAGQQISSETIWIEVNR